MNEFESGGRYNTKIKRYRDGSYTITYCDTCCFVNPEELDYSDDSLMPRISDIMKPFETEEEKERKKKTKSKIERSDNMKRAVDKIYDIALQNDWSYFMTITIDPEQFDSKNPLLVCKKLSKWLNNQVNRKGLQYLLIPELHKNGGIHAHALINDCFSLVPSGRYLYGGKAYKEESLLEIGVDIETLKPVYNVPEWKYGFSTAIPVDGTPARLACYITKYITKDCKKIFGKYYLSSRNLVRDTEIRLCNTVKFNDLENVAHHHGGMAFKYISDFRMNSEDDREVPENIIAYLAERGSI